MCEKGNLRSLLVMFLLLLAIATTANAKTIYVDANVSGGGGGTSWADAYNYLQDGLADANTAVKPVEIYVAQGTYKPDQGASVTAGVRTETFQLINGVTLEGGYAGDGQPDPNARDISNNVTILCGDLDGDDVVVSNPSDLLTDPNRAENSYHVVMGGGTDPTAVLDGFTITAGNANSSVPNANGAGLYSSDGSPGITNCTFSGNSALTSGGGMTIGSNGGTLSNCTFNGNSANSGGGMAVGTNGGTLTNCTFNGNSANYGGGTFNNGEGSLTFINCSFIGNSASIQGGGILDQAWEGGTQTLINCIFSGNSASSGGGGFSGMHSYSTFTNCTFSENSAGAGGAIHLTLNTGTADFNNCILWGNTADGEGPQIAVVDVFGDGYTITVNYSDVQGGDLDIYIESGNTLIYHDPNNIESDPLFVDADGLDNTAGTEDDDLHLRWSSPCINTGDPSVVFNSNERDIDDEPRVMVSRVDMGSDEVGEKQGDFNRDGIIDGGDFIIFIQAWLSIPGQVNWYVLCDLYNDGTIDILDFAEVSKDWLWQASWY